MKLKRSIFILLSVIFALIVSSAPVKAEDMMDNLLPQQEKDKAIYTREGDVILEYNKYPVTRYGMETQLEQDEVSDLMPWGWDDNIGKQLSQWQSMIISYIWGMNRIFSSTIGTLVSEAFNADIVGSLSDEVTKTVQSIAGYGPGGFHSTGLWPYMVYTLIMLTGIWAAYLTVVKKSSSRAISGILSSIIILALALTWFSQSDKILAGINDGVKEVQNDVLSNFVSVTTPGNYKESEGIATMRNQIFNVMIKQPYLLLNFGTTDEKKIESEWEKKGSRVDAVLKTGVFSKERKDAVEYEVKELKNKNMQPTALTDRLIVLSLVSIFNFILGAVLLLMSGSMIFYQIMILIFSLFTPVALLIGLIPAFSRTATNIFMKIAHAFLMKAGLAFLASVYFSISSMVYKSMDPQVGYIMLFVFQIICGIALWIKRHEVLNIVSTPFRSAGVNSNVGQSVGEYKKNYFKTKKHLNKVIQPFTKVQTRTLADRTGYNALKFNPGVGVVNPRTHPIFKTKERSVGNKVAAQPAAVTVERSQTAKESAPPNINKPTLKRESPLVIKSWRDEHRNLESLESTLQKGGHAHNTKENVQLKGKQSLKGQLVERHAAAQNNQKPILHDRPTPKNTNPNQNKKS